MVADDYLRLTPASTSRVGYMWNTQRVDMLDWEVVLEFKISGGGRLGADGLAFWYAQESGIEGPVFGSKDNWVGLLVAFDTFDNDNQVEVPHSTN